MADAAVENKVDDPKPDDKVTDKPELVDKKELENALADLHKYKKEARELKVAQEQAKLDALKKNQEWEQIAKLKEEEALTASQRAEKLQESYLADKKYTAVREAAMKLGIRPEALQDLDLVDLAGVVIETTSTGKVNVLGAEQFVQKVKTTRPHWFGNAKAPNINTADPTINTGGEVTVNQILEAQKKGDNTLYQNLSRKYQEQKSKKH